MKYNYLALIVILIAAMMHVSSAQAAEGDTTVVKAFTFGSVRDSVINFPPASLEVERIIMKQTLKCNPAQDPACGEWDYLTYMYVYDHTGNLDSTLMQQASFTYNGSTPDSVSFMNSPAYNYFVNWEYFTNRTGVTSFDSAIVGAGVVSTADAFPSNNSDGRSQFIWTAAELSAAGLTAGDISGIRFDVTFIGSAMRNMTIRLKESSQDSIDMDSYENSGFTTVYSRNTSFASLGSQTIDFTNNFNWTGGNLLIDISFDNTGGGGANMVNGDNTAFPSGIMASETDYSLDFDGADHVEVPVAAFASIDSFITISFWQYGDPDRQPQNDYAFEGLNANGDRVLNSHLPWSNSQVYWDAGQSGGYDRINKTAGPSDFEGKWNHWAFTKNVATGTMNIYLNGNAWHSGTGKTRLMDGITKFKIGANGNSTNWYDGMIDEFRVFDVVVSEANIQDWMHKDVDATHPNYANLQAYYKFNEGTGNTTADASANGHTANVLGMPNWLNNQGSELFRNINNLNWRPNIVLEQGVYTATIDSVLREDSIEMAMRTIVIYGDSLNATTPTDTLYVWPEYYNAYVYDANGIATDSTLVATDSTLYKQEWPYYGNPFEVVDRYEIGRYITPYGIGLDLGEGFAWWYDVSDYRNILVDSVHLTSGNWQEFQDITFYFIEGTPTREVLSVETLWGGSWSYGSMADDVNLQNTTFNLNPAADMYRLKTRTTGHGFGSGENCAEFCRKKHRLEIDGTKQFEWWLWDECADNPVQPQGGTWVYDRAGWCPGKDVKTYNWELTPHVTPGSTFDLDYGVDAYVGSPNGNYVTQVQLISYGDYNFTLDAAIVDMKKPSTKQIYQQHNPMCGQPEITIMNNGSTTITTLDIVYGMEGGSTLTHNWVGSLDPLETEIVTLESMMELSWPTGADVFTVTLSNPNGGTDEYAPNNSISDTYVLPTDDMPDRFAIWLKTNLMGAESSYKIMDDVGAVVFSKSNLAGNTVYKDTVELAAGCYTFLLEDADDDGLDWWANSDGSGYCRFRGVIDGSSAFFHTFDPDFGKEARLNFTVDWKMNVPQTQFTNSIEVFPNPAQGELYIDLSFEHTENVDVRVYNSVGKMIYHEQMSQIQQKLLELDLSNEAPGIYMVNIQSETQTETKRIVLQ